MTRREAQFVPSWLIWMTGARVGEVPVTVPTTTTMEASVAGTTDTAVE
jgi:hypothetical protein